MPNVLRGLRTFVVWICGLWAVALVGGLGLVAPVKWVTYPHDMILLDTGDDTYPRVFPGLLAIVVAILQWTVVAAAYGRISRGWSRRAAFWIAPAVISVTGVCVFLLILSSGAVLVGGVL